MELFNVNVVVKMDKIKQIVVRPVMAFVIGLVILTTPSCEDGSLNPLDFNAFAPSDDVALGQQLDQEIKNNPQQYPIYNNEAARSYVQSIVNEIIKAPQIKYRDVFSYQVQIIQDNNTVNAFATPGGYVYVYTGLIKFLDDEASLAGVLAHEVAHAEERHATLRITHAYGIEFILSLILGDNPSQFEQIAANIVGNLALLKNSREDESEADERSFEYLQSTMWYPGAILYFFDKVKKNSQSSFLEELLSTHPMPEERLAAIQKMVDDAKLPPPSENNLFRQRYQNFKQTIP